MFDCILLIFYNSVQHNGDVSPESYHLPTRNGYSIYKAFLYRSANVEQIMKYTIHKFSLVVSAINIHPVWLMDE
jgi:hypothetical protein